MKKYKAVVFDLDGTLADTRLDFVKMREDLQFPLGVSILEHLETLPLDKKDNANRIILEHEIAGAKSSTLTSGAKELLDHLEEKNIPMAIQTRNCKDVTDLVIGKLKIPISKVLTREDSRPKPDPHGFFQIVKDWNIDIKEILYVGDSHYDLQTSLNAKSDFALFTNLHNESKEINHPFSVSCLSQLISYF